MKIRNFSGLTVADLHDELVAGGRFVTYQSCFSFLFFSFRPVSDVYFVPAGKSGFWQGLPYTITALLFGWWALPWGAVHTLAVVAGNLQGGTDVTETAVAVILSRELATPRGQHLQWGVAA